VLLQLLNVLLLGPQFVADGGEPRALVLANWLWIGVGLLGGPYFAFSSSWM
jgi:hypothetical protein